MPTPRPTLEGFLAESGYGEQQCSIVSTLSADMLEGNGTLSCFAGETLLAMDIEGVDLGRSGIVSLIQLATREHCFVFDVQEKPIEDPLVLWLKTLLEDSNITKIVHDCRMDSDALQHCLGITIENVHDTSCWHSVLFAEVNPGLNQILQRYNIPQNKARDGSIYKKNYEFWKQRPLTPHMIAWAVGDIAGLFAIYDQQKVTSQCEQKSTAQNMSNKAVGWARAAKTCKVEVLNPRNFVGPGGRAVNALRARSNTLLYHRGNRQENIWVVYYDRECDARMVAKAAARA